MKSTEDIAVPSIKVRPFRRKKSAINFLSSFRHLGTGAPPTGVALTETGGNLLGPSPTSRDDEEAPQIPFSF